MEFGILGFDGFDQNHQQQVLLQGKPKYSYSNNNNNNTNGLIKQERSDPFSCTGNPVSKMGIGDNDFGLRSDHGIDNKQQQMLSFSSPYSNNSKTSNGFGCGNMNGGSLTGIRGPFTPAQWIELEHQAMIYKYLTANVPVPSNLLIPIRKAIHSAGFPAFSFASYPSHSYGWGGFHLGYSGNTDPEPGRCRRTDGKKWRCSRDAVPDQKYCERHINRGRHRSRKPVEGHTGQAASGATPTKVVTSNSGGVPNGVGVENHHIKGLRPSNTSIDPIIKCLNDQQGLSVMRPTINIPSEDDARYSIPKQHLSFGESSVSDFGVVSNDSFLNPIQKNSYLDCKNYDTSDWTQLSMSIPMSTDFSSSSSSPIRDKGVVSLSRELDPFQMGLGVGVGTIVSKRNSWENSNLNSMGGPLGEVLLSNARWDESNQLGNSPTGVLQKSTFVSASNSSSGGSPRGGPGPMRTLESSC